MCDYKYCFQDVVIKWLSTFLEARIFLNSSINGMLQKRIIPPCEKILVDGRNPVPVFLLGDPTYPLLPFLLKEFSGGGRNEREKFFNYKLSSARIPIENSFRRLTHYSPVLLFYIPWKHQKSFGFSDVFRGYRKANPGCNELKTRFRCLQRAMDVKLDTLPQVIYLCFILHNYYENKKENLPDQNLMSALSFEKTAQSLTISLTYGERVNENTAISIRNTLTLYFE